MQGVTLQSVDEDLPTPAVSAFVGSTVNMVLYLARASRNPSSEYFTPIVGRSFFPELAPCLGMLTAFGVVLLPLSSIFCTPLRRAKWQGTLWFF